MVYCYLIVLLAHACCLCAEGAYTVNFQDQEFDTSDPNQFEGKCPWPYLLLLLFWFELV